jgi:RNA polymerase sigma factor (TIGR02999 family)
MPGTEEVTRLLLEWRGGNEAAMQRLLPVIYGELRRLAAWCMRQERPGHTLQATALVHEAYLKLVAEPGRDWQSRAHFFAVAANVMRNILVDYARARRADKRGGGREVLHLDEALTIAAVHSKDLVALEECLVRLEKLDSRAARIVELRWFAGLGVDEVAALLSVSPKTVKRDWAAAKAWLQGELEAAGRGRP